MTDRKVHKLPGIEGPESAAALAELINGPLLSSGLIAHFDGAHAGLITTPVASDLATLKTLTLAATNAIVAHGLDSQTTGDGGAGQHSAVDAALDVPAGFTTHPAEPADLAECQATINQLKIDLTGHLINATPHRGGGEQGGFSPTAITTTDGSTQGTNETLLNAIVDAFHVHIKSGIRTFTQIDG